MSQSLCPQHLNLEQLVSTPRFQAYKTYLSNHQEVLLGRNLDTATKRLYMWDTSLAAALLPSIAFTEVILRNAMNSAICHHFNIESAVGWHTLLEGQDPIISLIPNHKQQLDNDIKRIKGRIQRTPTGDEVVSGVSLGIWGLLLDKGNHQNAKYHYEVEIWRAYLHKAFPNFSGARRQLRDKVRQLSKLRNRIAHHEPLILLNVAHGIDNAASIISYIDREASHYLLAVERTTVTLRRRDAYLDGDCSL
ncbi:MAG: hypothetical protein ACRCSF_09075 [Mycobacteriaceae bacterium]